MEDRINELEKALENEKERNRLLIEDCRFRVRQEREKITGKVRSQIMSDIAELVGFLDREDPNTKLAIRRALRIASFVQSL